VHQNSIWQQRSSKTTALFTVLDLRSRQNLARPLRNDLVYMIWRLNRGVTQSALVPPDVLTRDLLPLVTPGENICQLLGYHWCVSRELRSQPRRGLWWDPQKYPGRVALQIISWQSPTAAVGIVACTYVLFEQTNLADSFRPLLHGTKKAQKNRHVN